MKISREAENSKPSQSHISSEGAARQQLHVGALEPSSFHTRVCLSVRTVSAKSRARTWFLERGVLRSEAQTEGPSLK